MDPGSRYYILTRFGHKPFYYFAMYLQRMNQKNYQQISKLVLQIQNISFTEFSPLSKLEKTLNVLSQKKAKSVFPFERKPCSYTPSCCPLDLASDSSTH